MKILVACEESQAVTIELRALGHEAYSCDIQPCSGGHPEWHLQQDVLEVLKQEWDMMIAFPPCTHLAVSGAAWFKEKRADGRQQEGIDFFLALANADIEKIAIENPIGIMSNLYKEPTQIIHPYYFGDSASKATCLWLKNLPKLIHYAEDDLFNKKTHTELKKSKTANGIEFDAWWYSTCKISIKNGERAKARSKTFPGIAKAMASQWTV